MDKDLGPLPQISKWYWMVCYNCGYKDSSQNFNEISHGDDASVTCPKCFSGYVDEDCDREKLEGPPPNENS